MTLRAIDATLEIVVLGRIEGEDDTQRDDPMLPVGTVCTVVERLQDQHITSQPAFIVLAEAEGKMQRLWAYAGELVLVQRAQ